MKKLLAWVVVALAFCPATSNAQVFVKPSNHQAIALRVQSLRADVEIVGAFAITNWQMEVQMENVGFGAYNEGVCDFIIARPRDAKVTAFSVEQWQKKLVGRVVEKSLAAPRLAFRAAPGDPLLKSGLNAGNSFRATIYPINSWNGVTLRGTWVQVLPALKNRSIYRLPLLSLKGATTRLPELNAKITVREGDLQGLSNNYGLPVKTQAGTRTVALNQKNYRILRDLVVNIARQNAPLQGALLVAPNAQKDGGHFALALAIDRDAKTIGLSGRGVATLDVLGPKSARAGQTLLFSGIYRGEVSQIGWQLTTNESTRDVAVTARQFPVAAALWATQKIDALGTDALGTDASKRGQIIALSKTYSVASRFTSWLAVGDQDLKIYARALVSSQLDPLVREYWVRVGDGQGKSARVVRLRSAIAQISRANQLNAEDELYTRLGSAINYAAWKGWHYGRAPRTREEKRLVRLNAEMTRFVKSLGVKEEESREPQYRVYAGKRDELYELRTKIIAEYRKPHPDYGQLKGWELRFARLYGSSDLDPRLDFWRAQVKARDLEAQTQNAEKAGDKPRLAQIQDERNQNSRNAYFTNNIGDPPIYVSAPSNARQVVAIMPDGKIKVLDYNAIQGRWEGNYDIPTTMRDGTYSIQIVVVSQAGVRRRYAMKFRVDTTPPGGRGQVLLAPATSRSDSQSDSQSAKHPQPLRLEITHGGDVARVTALLPWGEKVALLPSTADGLRFFALVMAPRGYAGQAIRVTYILVDRAHNLTRIEAESVSMPSP